MEQKARERGLEINVKKSKYMHCHRNQKKKLTTLELGTYVFEEVKSFKYLETMIIRNNERTHIKN